MGTQENKSTIRTWVEAAWNQGAVDGHDELYAPSYNPAFLPEPFPHTFDGLKAFIRHYRTGMPDLHLAIEDMVAEGDTVAWRFVATGTQMGELFGFPTTGRAARVGGMVFSRFQDGRWVEDHSQHDTLGLLQQLGLIPAPSGARA